MNDDLVNEASELVSEATERVEALAGRPSKRGRGRRLLKIALWLIILNVALYAATLLARRMLGGVEPDPDADEFDIVNVTNGTEFASRATALRGGSVRNYLGGVDLDLRGAQLAAGGGVLEVDTMFGGTRLIVPPSWRIELRGTPQAGAHELDVDQPLSPEAPVLTIDARTVCGALEVTAHD